MANISHRQVRSSRLCTIISLLCDQMFFVLLTVRSWPKQRRTWCSQNERFVRRVLPRDSRLITLARCFNDNAMSSFLTSSVSSPCGIGRVKNSPNSCSMQSCLSWGWLKKGQSKLKVFIKVEVSPLHISRLTLLFQY